MHALYQEILPPSGIEHATHLKLTPATVATSSALINLVIAKANVLRIFELHQESENILRPYFIREHHLHGIITGLQGVKILSGLGDGLDRLLVSFKDAKIALLEWSDYHHDLQTVSIHTYERAPQLMAMDSQSFLASLRLDPQSRCAALSLPKDSLAILPFNQSHPDLDPMDTDQAPLEARYDTPYSPSFILDLQEDVHPDIQHVVDFVFLPGFQKPTLAILSQKQQTWTGRLKEFKDTCSIHVFTLDVLGQSHAIISTVDTLPFDSLALIACSPTIGGFIVHTSNSIIYANSSRRVVLPLNGWPSRISDLPTLPVDDPQRSFRMEGARFAWIDDKNLLCILKDGRMWHIDVFKEGVVTTLKIGKESLGTTTIPCGALQLDKEKGLLFIWSSVGPSVIVKVERREIEVEDAPKTEAPTTHQMDVDDYDEDIYGPLPTAISSEPTQQKKKIMVTFHPSLCCHLPAYGSICDMAFGVANNGDRLVPELVVATGSGELGGFELFQRDLPFRIKRRPHSVGGLRGIWSLPVYPSNPILRPNLVSSRSDTLILSTDATPSPGLSRITVKHAKGDVQVTTRISGLTIGAAAFFGGTAILHVMANCIRVVGADGSERQVIKDLDASNIPRAKIRSCSILDPFVMIFREDDTIGLFIGELERGKIRRKDMSPLGDKTSKYLTGCFFEASQSVFSFGDSSTTESPVNGVPKSVSNLWLLLIRPQGTMEIWTLPKLAIAFSTNALGTLQPTLTDSLEQAALSLPQDPPRQSGTVDIEQVLVTHVGQNQPRPYLFVLLRSGHMAGYEILSSSGIHSSAAATDRQSTSGPRIDSSSLKIHFVKIVSRVFDIRTEDGQQQPQQPQQQQPQNTILVESKKIFRHFIPFSTKYHDGTQYQLFHGLFLTGENPHWIIGTDLGGVRMFPSGHSLVHAFTPCSIWNEKAEFLVYTEEGANLLEWVPNYRFTDPLPSRRIPRGRPYSNVVFDIPTSTVVAAANLEAEFTSYDEEGNQLWAPDAMNISHPTTDCSTLELISSDTWVTMDGYEFSNNEFVNSVETVSLESTSTENGTKEFVAVGTSINRGEDLACKGATYIFEIVEVVPDPELSTERWYKLKLRCKDEAKGPITAVAGMNGYLVSSMGQKIFVRALDQDERLVGIAFLDVGIYVTSLRVLKNLLLIGDAVKSTMFVAFQEDPYKLVILARDRRNLSVTCSDFLFVQDETAIIAGDEDGIIRMYEYNPTDLESKDGRYLLLRSEFNTQNEYRSTALIARRVKDDPVLPQAKLLLAMTNGGLSSLTPIDDSTAKRLQLLQGQLTRNMQHVAGLNPKAHRIARNDFISKSLSKGILDGTLLYHFEGLSLNRQDDMTKQIGTEKGTMARDLSGLSASW